MSYNSRYRQRSSRNYSTIEELCSLHIAEATCYMMKPRLFLLLCLTGTFPVALSIMRGVPHKYYLIKTPKTWPLAQNYCRTFYTDLATVESENDWARINKEGADKGAPTNAWIGLYDDYQSWRWSLNELPLKNTSYAKWYGSQPDNNGGKESCAYINGNGNWWDETCTNLKPFICYNASYSDSRKFVGVRSPTLGWYGARAYCQQYHTELASGVNNSENYLIQREADRIGTSWFGLYRDTWKWTDGTNVSNLLWRSGQPNNYWGKEYCGTRSYKKIDDFKCTDQYGFFCHTIPPVREQQTVKLLVRSGENLFDPAVQSAILDMLKQKLEEYGMLENTTVTWRVHPDGNIFHKKSDDDDDV